ncbi:MAG: AAA family ATPase, partial [Candidatus Nanopelagicales bacterium]
RARDTRKPHNRARVTFVREIISRLADQLARKLRMNIDDDVRQDLIADLRESRDVRREVNLCWMPVTAERLVAEFLSDRKDLVAAAGHLSDAQIDALLRPTTCPWTVSDVPLLDEAAELLGDWDPHEATIAAAKARAAAADVAYAREVLAGSGAAAKMITAEKFAERFSQSERRAPLAERAAADREWAYGHLVVDEAQELTAMQWRMVMRRCPTRSMTLVGDPDQTAAAGGVGSWRDALAPFVQDRWRIAQLTINYRTPARIMASAAAVLTAAGIDASPPESVRAGDRDPQYLPLAELATATVAEVIREQCQRLGHGTVAIIVAKADRRVATSAVHQAAEVHADTAPAVSVFTAAEAKGLEFDGVIVLEPATICAEAARAPQDLYVCMTRPTRDLIIAHHQALPEFVERARQIAKG